MKKLGILGAMDEEIRGIIEAFEGSCTKAECGRAEVFCGNIGGIEVCAAKSGIGKVNAAFMATMLIERFGVDALVMTGVAGGLSAKTMDAVISSGFVQHDVFMPDVPEGYIDVLNTVVIPADIALSEKLAKGGSALRGLIATGEMFVMSPELNRIIRQRFPDAVAVDMESAAAAQVCARLNVPFAAVKIISDGCDDNEYFDFKTLAAYKAVSFALGLIKNF